MKDAETTGATAGILVNARERAVQMGVVDKLPSEAELGELMPGMGVMIWVELPDGDYAEIEGAKIESERFWVQITAVNPNPTPEQHEFIGLICNNLILFEAEIGTPCGFSREHVVKIAGPDDMRPGDTIVLPELVQGWAK